MIRAITLLLALVRTLVEFSRDRQLLEAGRTQEALDALDDAKDRLSDALEARRHVRRLPPERLRDDDGHRRD